MTACFPRYLLLFIPHNSSVKPSPAESPNRLKEGARARDGVVFLRTQWMPPAHPGTREIAVRWMRFTAMFDRQRGHVASVTKALNPMQPVQKRSQCRATWALPVRLWAIQPAPRQNAKGRWHRCCWPKDLCDSVMIRRKPASTISATAKGSGASNSLSKPRGVSMVLWRVRRCA